MVNIPKTRRTFCKGKSCRKHTLHKITQYRTGKQRKHTQGRRRSGIKQQRIDGQTMPIFHKKSKTTKKTILRMQCIECQYKNQVTIKRAKFVELGGEKKQRNEIDPW